MDEVAERAKLELLDLTEDVIELILEKKRKTYASRIIPVSIPEIEEGPADQPSGHPHFGDQPSYQAEEPTYYPPVETIPQDVQSTPTPPQKPISYRWGWFRKK